MTSSQIAAACRHVATFLGGVVTAIAALHVISGSDAKVIGDAITKISGDVADIAVALGPLIAVASATWATWKQSHVQQIKAVNAIDGVKVTNENAPGKVVTTPPGRLV